MSLDISPVVKRSKSLPGVAIIIQEFLLQILSCFSLDIPPIISPGLMTLLVSKSSIIL